MTGPRADQYACTEAVLEETPEAAIISNLGVSSYILIDVEDRPRNFYMTGAMGMTTPMGLGLALSVDDDVVVLDGDGSLLMSLGALSTVGTYGPSNLTIVVWDNSVFQTTGGQSTLSRTTDFAGVAENCGVSAWEVRSTEEFRSAYRAAVDHDGPSLVACSVEPVTPEGTPPLDYSHSHHKHRFQQALTSE
jgi:thiamine pyrophosphate-dependent acetolactate synthase large subunit-like protein